MEHSGLSGKGYEARSKNNCQVTIVTLPGRGLVLCQAGGSLHRLGANAENLGSNACRVSERRTSSADLETSRVSGPGQEATRVRLKRSGFQ